MSTRRVVPIVAFVAVLVALVGVRVLVGGDDTESDVATDTTTEVESTTDRRRPRSPAASASPT